MDVIETCKKEIIDFVSLPANLTDKTQPLEVAYFGPLMVVPEALPPIVPAYHPGTAPQPIVTVSQARPLNPSAPLFIPGHPLWPPCLNPEAPVFIPAPAIPPPPAPAPKLSPVAEWWDYTTKPAIYPFPAACRLTGYSPFPTMPFGLQGPLTGTCEQGLCER